MCQHIVTESPAELRPELLVVSEEEALAFAAQSRDMAGITEAEGDGEAEAEADAEVVDFAIPGG